MKFNVITKTIDELTAPTYIVKTEAEADVLRCFNKMLIKAGKAPVKIEFEGDSMFSRARNFISKFILG